MLAGNASRCSRERGEVTESSDRKHERIDEEERLGLGKEKRR